MLTRENLLVTERYLDSLTVRLRGYAGFAVPGELAEEIVLQVDVGLPVDVERLAAELSENLGSPSRIVRYSITETNWGASGCVAELILEVPVALAALPVLWGMISSRILRHGEPQVLTPEEQRDLARRCLAESLWVGVDAIKIVGFEPVGDGHRVELETPLGTWEAETDSSGVTRMHRRSPWSDGGFR